MAGSALEETVLLHIRAVGLPEPVREYRFNPDRRWRFDFCWPDRKIALEVEGGIYAHGRHNRPVGYEADIEKYNSAMLLGWDVYRCTGSMIKSGAAIQMLEQLLQAKGK